MDKIKIDLPIIVEGKYDKIKVSSVIDGEIITTDGFGVFKSREKLALIKRLSQNGVVILTDSDGAGKLIRSHISGSVPADKIYNLYIPKIKGKEKRKREGSKEGTLGVEGVDADIIRSIFETFLKNHTVEPRSGEKVTKTDLFTLGLSGSEGSSERRDRIAEKLGLPSGLTAPAFLSAVNVIMTREEFLLLVQSTEEQ
ncbi:MAG: DUF4093 domain-containing protein [Ruminococcaceae bacterium]|nr:DUF4093 domain-containing protein [Oscillospiraceae bacterium]